MLATHLAGFSTDLVVEWDRWSCDTLRENQACGHPLAQGMQVLEGDVRGVDWSKFSDDITLVSGGPPCQPFSGGGRGRAADDDRDMFPATAEVIRVLRPKAFIVENVRGLTRSAFADYYSYIQLRLAHPELVSRGGESWGDHFARLRAEHASVRSDLQYRVAASVANAADYGVPQQRWRVFIVGFRLDIDSGWSFPAKTHSADALRRSKTDGDYWERHEVPRKYRERPKFYGSSGESLRPWRTVRDALVGLPEPTTRGSDAFLNHVLQPGARSYPGHTGSYIDLPAKALKAGVHGVPGGENMLRDVDDSIRYFTIREAARLQTFPDRYVLHGPWGEAMRQLGNAVPIRLAEVVAASVHEHLALAELRAAGVWVNRESDLRAASNS